MISVDHDDIEAAAEAAAQAAMLAIVEALDRGGVWAIGIGSVVAEIAAAGEAARHKARAAFRQRTVIRRSMVHADQVESRVAA